MLTTPRRIAHLDRSYPVRCRECHGTGRIDERAADLWSAGIFVAGATDEDFRSSPTLWAP